MFSKKLLALLVLSVIFYGCASSPDKGSVSKEGDIQREWVEEGITDNYIFARGIGAADQALDNKTQKMATSRNAAIVSAQYNMLSLIKGVNLEGGITVEKAMETDSLLATNINATIKGAQVVRSEWTSDDGCVVILRLSKKALKDMGLKMLSK
ncbi:MAG TPA: hypothetical protein DEE98_07370 [Elusimicrobia bacterium]|nr:MAG: hypothetical protein A2278_01555 [Elusimicrobia bacterium RIFOXYA12_FULL_49_49]OGS06112.1 MAG: hypothetical protein A2204_01810 [Elusimicrobia bacterium RIFOXYA1_FULL_47_7]OGS10781.1 MAG: hypothetical protein A2386_06120 [Elusimicrobia bacterium RIFOXYB1_FULL_48_9]OGS16737.1 MAG: hypothetical protein A2251_05005 [Elusimicrobia bacterium RIFOXYA2_FULL_47_53]OGS27019.1 MAG: hypothetical protein A2339_04860 [Elusimicrobia bacterium RIFOXYB12_FULL_50_12]OGS31965.1 MAG: hypothetical protein